MKVMTLPYAIHELLSVLALFGFHPPPAELLCTFAASASNIL